jgi:aminoglycoside phosphotransferase
MEATPGSCAGNTPRLPRIAVLRGEWLRFGERTYGAAVYRVGDRFVKLAPRAWGPADLRVRPAAEAERLRWLGAAGFPVPEVVEVGADDDWSWLVTAAVPGVPVPRADDPAAAVDALAELTRALHGLDPATCPYGLGLAELLGWARRAVAEELVDTGDLDPAHAGRTPADLLAQLEATPAPAEGRAVAHGDLTPDNVLVDRATGRVTAVLDPGRLGVSDPWRDLAVARRDLAELDPRLPDRFLRGCGAPPDPARESYYRLVDEFL